MDACGLMNEMLRSFARIGRLTVDSPLSTLTDKLCQPVEVVVTGKEGIT